MKRAVFVPSSRGGVGKSTFVRLLAELHRERESGAVLVDADSAVGQLLKHLGERDAETGRVLREQSIERGVQTMDWHADVRGRDAIASWLEHGRYAVFDLPGGSLSTLKMLDAETNFFAEVVPSMGYATTVVVMVTPYLETWADAKQVAEWVTNAEVLLVRNEGFGESQDFRDWDASETRRTLLESGAREIVLPRLEARIAARISYHRLRFHDAPTNANIHVMDRGRAKTWLTAATAAIHDSSDLVGLDSVADTPTSTKATTKRGVA